MIRSSEQVSREEDLVKPDKSEFKRAKASKYLGETISNGDKRNKKNL